MTVPIAIIGTGEMGLKYAEALAKYTTDTRFVAVAGGTLLSGTGPIALQRSGSTARAARIAPLPRTSPATGLLRGHLECGRSPAR